MRNRRFKSICFLILFAFFTVSLAGCGSSTVSTTTAARSSTKSSATSKNTENTTAAPMTTITTPTEASTVAPTDPPTAPPTEPPTEAPTTAVEPIIIESYTLNELLTDYTNGCTLAMCRTKSALFIALIDEEGYVLWKESSKDFTDAKYHALSNGLFVIEKQARGNEYFYNSKLFDNPRLFVLDNTGRLVFDSREQEEGYRYYYEGYYGEGGIVIYERYADFSNEYYNIRQLTQEGEIQDIPGLSNWYEFVNSRLVYCGNGVFVHYVPGNGGDLTAGTYIYNVATGNSMAIAEETSTYSAPVRFDWVIFIGDRALIRFAYVTVLDDASENYVYNIPRRAFENRTDCQEIFNNLGSYQVGKLAYVNRDELANGLINYQASSYLLEADLCEKSGVYSYSGELLGLYPENWDISSLSAFNEAGFAYVFLNGADGNEWFTVVDSKAKPQFDPIKKTDENFNNIEAQYDILWEEEEQPVPYIVKKMEEGGKVNLYEVSNYQELKEAGIIIGEPTPAQQPSQSLDSKTYTSIKGFTITGTWKNAGSYTYGQAQSGAIIVFDGSRCNFFSPSDTYAFYAEDDHYRLDCTSPLGDTVSFIVRIIDENHIDIFNGQNVVELTRIVQ